MQKEQAKRRLSDEEITKGPRKSVQIVTNPPFSKSLSEFQPLNAQLLQDTDNYENFLKKRDNRLECSSVVDCQSDVSGPVTLAKLGKISLLNKEQQKRTPEYIKRMLHNIGTQESVDEDEDRQSSHYLDEEKEEENEKISKLPSNKRNRKQQKKSKIQKEKENLNSDEKQNIEGEDSKIGEFDHYDQGVTSSTPINKGPRRPLSPYIFFSQEKRKELKRQHPEWNSCQIMKQVSILWQKMSSEDKKKFQEQSKEDRERYENQRQEFIHKKEEESSHEQTEHNVLETVKSRAKKLAEEKSKRKLSDEQLDAHGTPHRKGRRSRKQSHTVTDEKRSRKHSHVDSVGDPQLQNQDSSIDQLAGNDKEEEVKIQMVQDQINDKIVDTDKAEQKSEDKARFILSPSQQQASLTKGQQQTFPTIQEFSQRQQQQRQTAPFLQNQTQQQIKQQDFQKGSHQEKSKSSTQIIIETPLSQQQQQQQSQFPSQQNQPIQQLPNSQFLLNFYQPQHNQQQQQFPQFTSTPPQHPTQYIIQAPLQSQQQQIYQYQHQQPQHQHQHNALFQMNQNQQFAQYQQPTHQQSYYVNPIMQAPANQIFSLPQQPLNQTQFQQPNPQSAPQASQNFEFQQNQYYQPNQNMLPYINQNDLQQQKQQILNPSLPHLQYPQNYIPQNQMNPIQQSNSWSQIDTKQNQPLGRTNSFYNQQRQSENDDIDAGQMSPSFQSRQQRLSSTAINRNAFNFNEQAMQGTGIPSLQLYNQGTNYFTNRDIDVGNEVLEDQEDFAPLRRQ